MEDAELVGLARDGDVRAYEELVGRYRDLAFRTAWLVTRSSAEAEDAAQEAFVKAYYAMPRFRPGAPFKPWILRIVANEAKNRGRSARRRDALALRAAAADPGGAVPSPEAAALEREEQQELLAAIARLPERDRLVLGYRYFLDLSEADMAEALDCRPGTVKSRLSRATAHLRAELGGSP
ncbi:MAG: sigma-70 family RNA polymerase sigma factor [Actinobacteria bacterium]|nr:sigma-70 family RNA polymerase sigma factor [Actinomycetota bacterium]